jgi:ectoine hydroxylase-related dioxygenase (phytanoyl-CoA dioxygenase family)
MDTVHAADADVAHYNNVGWHRVNQLIDRDTALLLRRRFDERGHALRPTVEAFDPTKSNYHNSAEVQRMHVQYLDTFSIADEFRSVVLSPRIGAVVRRLLGAKRVQLYRTSVFEKEPEAAGGLGTSAHQDFPYLSFDRSRSLTVWIALGDLPASTGTLRFVDGSHRLGSLGRDHVYLKDDDYLKQRMAKEEWVMSPAADLSAGDATIHADLMVHGSDANLGDTPRIALVSTYFDARTLFNGAPSPHTDGLDLEVNRPFPIDLFPPVSD